MSTRRPCLDAKERADLDAFNALDPAARTLVVGILGIFVADALASAAEAAAAAPRPARGTGGTDATETERCKQGASPRADRRPKRPDDLERGTTRPGVPRWAAGVGQPALNQA